MDFTTLFIVFAVSLVGPLLNISPRFTVPLVICDLVVGILLGTTGADLLQSADPTFTFMAQVGFAMVMLVAGTHVPLRNPAIVAGLRTGTLRAVGVGLLAVPLGYGVAWAFGTGHGAVYAVILASSSASIVLPLLGATQVTSREGLAMLAQIALADAACIVALPLVMSPSGAGRAALGSLAVIGAAGAFFLFLLWLEKTGLRERSHEMSKRRELGLEVRVVLVAVFAIAALARSMGVSVMLAGFAAGLAIAGSGEPHRVRRQLFAITQGFFAPIFFIWLGSSLNLRELVADPSGIAIGVALGLGAVALHGAMALLRQPLPVAVATSAQLGVPIGAAGIGTAQGLFSSAEATGLLLGALITIAAVTAAARWLVPQMTSPTLPSAAYPR
nr:cation:proton antiporter [Corynebacterium lactis]